MASETLYPGPDEETILFVDMENLFQTIWKTLQSILMSCSCPVALDSYYLSGSWHNPFVVSDRTSYRPNLAKFKVQKKVITQVKNESR